MIGARAPQPPLDLGDPPLEVVDQLKAGVDVTKPRLGDVELGEQPAAGDAEQVGHRAPDGRTRSASRARGS